MPIPPPGNINLNDLLSVSVDALRRNFFHNIW